jgi:hypothetical protein
MTTGKTALLGLFLVLACGCRTPQYVLAWPQLELGMTRERVKALLGEPTSVHAAQQVNTSDSSKDETTNELGKALGQVLMQGVFDLGHERWTYGEEAFFRPSDKAFCVYFGEDHRVNAYRKPTKGWYANTVKSDVSPPVREMPASVKAQIELLRRQQEHQDGKN